MKNMENMKNTALILMTALLVLMQGCKSERVPYNTGHGGEQDEQGYLVLDAFSLKVTSTAEEISTGTSSGVDSERLVTKASSGDLKEASDDYKVRIRSIKTGDELEYSYSDLKLEENSRIPLTPGSYVVSAESPDYKEYMEGEFYAEWNRPVYFGSVTKTVVKKTETAVDDLVCTLGNIKATVVLTPDLQSLFMSDAECEEGGFEKLSVTLSVGEHSLLYDRNVSEQGTPGYFKAVEESNTMKILLVGRYNKASADMQPEYVPVKWEKEIAGCKAGQWRKISIGIANANQGNVQFSITVENWAYDEKVDVDVMSMYVATEEAIPDEDISDKNSPVVSLVGGDINNGYVIAGSMYDDELGKWKDNLRLSVTPYTAAIVKSVDLVFDSDNIEFISALKSAGYANAKVGLWPLQNSLSPYVLINEDAGTGVLSITVTDMGMTSLFAFKGTHTVKIISRDDRYMTSYTTMTVKVQEGEIVVTAPEIVWKSQNGSKEYDFNERYNHNEVEIAIEVSTQNTFTGFTVDIISENVLTPGDLSGVGLSDHLDLINPGEFGEKLSGVGFPVGSEITGSKSVKFDITSFMSLLSMLNKEGNCDFKLSVTDETGVTVKTIQLNVVKAN